MGPSYAIKKGVRYRYYVSAMLAQGRKAEAGSVARVAAQEIEAVVLDGLVRAECPLPSTPIDRDTVAAHVKRITIAPGRVVIQLTETGQSEGTSNPIEIAWSPQPFRRKRAILATTGNETSTRPIRSEARSRLLSGIAQARRWLAEIMSGGVAGIEALALREQTSERAIRLSWRRHASRRGGKVLCVETGVQVWLSAADLGVSRPTSTKPDALTPA